MSDLQEKLDFLVMEEPQYVSKYAVKTTVDIRQIGVHAALASDAGKAVDIVKLLEPYLRLRKKNVSPAPAEGVGGTVPPA